MKHHRGTDAWLDVTPGLYRLLKLYMCTRNVPKLYWKIFKWRDDMNPYYVPGQYTLIDA